MLELGAGIGLPSLVCLSRSPALVVVTDFPTEHHIDCLAKNVDINIPMSAETKGVAIGFEWGEDVGEILELSSLSVEHVGFDLLLLADVIYNPSSHSCLLKSCAELMSKSSTSEALVAFSLHGNCAKDKVLVSCPCSWSYIVPPGA